MLNDTFELEKFDIISRQEINTVLQVASGMYVGLHQRSQSTVVTALIKKCFFGYDYSYDMIILGIIPSRSKILKVVIV